MSSVRRFLAGLWRTSRRQMSLLTPFALLVVLLILCAIRSPILFSGGGFSGLVGESAPLILAALALTPIAIAGPAGIDLAVGPLMNFINIGIVIGLSQLGWGSTNPVLVVCFAIGVGVLIGIFQGAVIALLRLQTVIVTLAGYLILAGLNLVWLSEPSGTAPTWLYDWLWSPQAQQVFSPALFVLLGAFVLWALLARSTFFRNLRLMGSDERTAYTSGVRLVATRIGAHAVAGVYVGLAAVMYTALIGSADPKAGAAFTLTAVTALVLGGASLSGGRASGIGAVLGAVDVWLISYILTTFRFGMAASYVVQLATGVVLVVALVAGGLLTDLARRRRRMRGQTG